MNKKSLKAQKVSIGSLHIKRYLTIIPRARVGYEVIDSQPGAKRRVGYNHLISNKREWNNCFIKNHQQILLDFADFAWLEQPEGNLMDAISRVWYNGSYTIAAKPIKTLELHYTMIQFLIKWDIFASKGSSFQKDTITPFTRHMKPYLLENAPLSTAF